MEHAKCACSAQSLMCLVFLPAMDQWLAYIIITSKHPSVGGTGRQFYLLRIQLWVIATLIFMCAILIDEKEEQTFKQEEKVSGGVWGIK